MKFLISILIFLVTGAAVAAEAERDAGYFVFENLEQVATATSTVAHESDLLKTSGAHWDDEDSKPAELSEAVYTKPACDCNGSEKRGLLTPFAEFMEAAARRPARKLTCGTFRGEASWYNLPGNRYFNGQRFDGSQNHAAHKTLPMGTVVTVHCPNGRSIDVTIVDDGPHVKGRIIDLVPAPANQCGVRQRGHAPVTLEVKCPLAKNESPAKPRSEPVPENAPTLNEPMSLDEEPRS